MKGELTDGQPTIRRREKWVDLGQVGIGMVISKQCKVNMQRERGFRAVGKGKKELIA